VSFDFSNLKEDRAAHYKIILIKNNIISTIFNLDTANKIIENTTDQQYLLLGILDSNKKFINIHNAIQLTNINLITVLQQCELNIDSDYKLICYYNVKHFTQLHQNKSITRPFTSLVKHISESDLDEQRSVLIYHNLNQLYVLTQVYDEDNEMLVPADIEFIDKNSIRVYFNYQIEDDYKIVLHTYKQELFSFDDTDHIVLESPGSYKNIMIVDRDNQKVLYPEQIIRSETQLEILFNHIGNYDIVVSTGIKHYSGSFESADLAADLSINITHNLETNFLLLQLFHNNNLFNPESIKIVDNNTINLKISEDDGISNYQISILSLQSQLPINTKIGNESYISEFNHHNLGPDNEITINHNLNSRYVIIQVYDDSDYLVSTDLSKVTDIRIVDANTITVRMHDLFLNDYYKVVILSIL
jgi:hypothetical protein